MRRRAEHVDATRLRITEAAVRLHTSVGPSNTSISTVAEEAGVTRLTVYRHFADLDELFDACRRHWYVLHPPPDTVPWGAIADLENRARRAYSDSYGWFHDVGDELYPIYRDMASLPESTTAELRAQWSAVADALLDGIELSDEARRPIRAVAIHLFSLMTWRSLIAQGLDQNEVVDVAVRLLLAAPPQR